MTHDFFDTTGAACQGYPTGWWYATGSATDAELARQICMTCPIVDPCRAAGRNGREWGTWGGETQHDRARAGYPARHDTHITHDPPPPGCGTRANYQYGCRCERCIRANWKERKRAERAATTVNRLRRMLGHAS